MAFYFESKRLDLSTDDELAVVINSKDAHEYGLTQGSRVYLCWTDVCIYVTLDYSDTIVDRGEIGLYSEVWHDYNIPAEDTIGLKLPDPPKSLEYIKKKMRGENLFYDEVYSIMEDISKRRLGIVEMTYFDAASYSPGFNDDEVYYMTKAMAETGDILDFSGGDPDKKVIDKHSIGGIPAKGITPILVPIVSCFEEVAVPNTSSRAITTPAGTSDMLETLMPVDLSGEDIINVVEKERGCLVWGGGLHLAPADDILINIKRILNMEAYETFLISIIAKKVAMKVTHLLIDVPYGPETKVPNISEVEKVQNQFEELCARFDIEVDVYKRKSLSPDGYGIGPVLEMRDVLRIFERHSDRPVALENTAIDMAGRLLELAGIVEKGKGNQMARSKLENGEAQDKFWQIAKTQGAKKRVKSHEMILAEHTQTIKAKKSGIVDQIENREVVEIARSLGAPFIKEAGIYFEKLVGENIKAGEPFLTLYATSDERLELGMEVYKQCGDFIHIG
jgi:AMP phosphorylase